MKRTMPHGFVRYRSVFSLIRGVLSGAWRYSATTSAHTTTQTKVGHVGHGF